MVAIDYFTRWPEAISVCSMHAEVVARALVDHVFTRFGPPAELHSDQGRTFEADVFKSVLNIMGTRKTRTTALHPQSDGAAERLIGSVVQQLSIIASQDKENWDLQVPLEMLSLRAASHTTTGVSPAVMLFGRDLNLPPALARGLPAPSAAPRLPRCQYPAWLS
jgi:transposase InsO family protein